jgi:SNF2 family DNA or RNA helicase
MHPLLKPHQIKTVEYNLKNKYVINALQMGLGKTFCSIETAVQKKARTLVICPAYLKLKWKSEILKFYPTAIVSVLDRPSQFYPLWDTDFCVISYSFVSEAEILFEWADMVVIDEAHYIKETNTKRTQAIHKLIYENSIKSCLLLTGTPIQNRVHEFYSLICICKYDPELKNDPFLDRYQTYVDFAEKFSYLSQYDMEVTTKKGKKVLVTVDKWRGVKNLPELKEILKGHYIEFKSRTFLIFHRIKL